MIHGLRSHGLKLQIPVRNGRRFGCHQWSSTTSAAHTAIPCDGFSPPILSAYESIEAASDPVRGAMIKRLRQSANCSTSEIDHPGHGDQISSHASRPWQGNLTYNALLSSLCRWRLECPDQWPATRVEILVNNTIRLR